MTSILYLVHDLDDPAVERRTTMLERGGAHVRVAGFHRGAPDAERRAGTVDLGRTHDARLAHRLGLVALRWADAARFAARLSTAPVDVIVARNLEMLVLAHRLAAALPHGPPVLYECLDIHRLMVRGNAIGRTLRAIEGRAMAAASGLIVSSPAFVTEYFERHQSAALAALPVLLVENRPLADAAPRPLATPASRGEPIRIGWFGALRCDRSLAMLSAFAAEERGRFEIVLRGRPALSAVPDFHERVRAAPHMRFLGPYTADELPAHYAAVDLAWAVDFFEESLNSSWLLPNRLYEGCGHGAVPVALSGTRTAATMHERGVGIALPDGGAEAMRAALGSLDRARVDGLRAAVRATDRSRWIAGPTECVHLVSDLAGMARVATPEHVAMAA